MGDVGMGWGGGRGGDAADWDVLGWDEMGWDEAGQDGMHWAVVVMHCRCAGGVSAACC